MAEKSEKAPEFSRILELIDSFKEILRRLFERLPQEDEEKNRSA
jgi:hypothetical protein